MTPNDAPSDDDRNDIQTCRLRVRGLVQGVGFRFALCAEARHLRLTGWVRNRHDGSVEALLHGPRPAVESLLDWAHVGPSAARVDAVELSPATLDEPLTGFEQRATV